MHIREPRPTEEIRDTRTMENIAYKKISERFRTNKNLSFFPFADFHVDEKLGYVDKLPELRVLTFAAKGVWNEADLNDLYARETSDQERTIIQSLERYWLHLLYQFQEAMDQFNLCPKGRRIIEFGIDTALLRNGEILKIEEVLLGDSDDRQEQCKRPQYITCFVNYARALVDAMFARILFAHDRGKWFFDKVEDYLDNKSPLKTEPSKKNALNLSLVDALEYGVESLKWQYKVDEEERVFNDVVNVTGRWSTQFKDPRLCCSGCSVAEINAIIKELTGKRMTRTTSQHIRELITRMSDENLAKFDLGRPITWLCLNNIINSNHKIMLPRLLRHNKRNTRKGSQEYSVKTYILRWIQLKYTVDNNANVGGSNKKARQQEPFTYNEIHFWLLQYIGYANTIQLGVENEYRTSKAVQIKIFRQFVNAFRYYNFETATQLICDLVSDIYQIYCDYYAKEFFGYCDQCGVREVLKQLKEKEQERMLTRNSASP